jgi:hypothetical protein
MELAHDQVEEVRDVLLEKSYRDPFFSGLRRPD